MTNEPGSTARTGPATTTDAEVEPARPAPALLAPAASVLALLALGWLAATLWSARTELHAAAADQIAITLAASALPVVVSAALVGGAAFGLLLGNLLTRQNVTRATSRFVLTTVSGLIVGFLAATVVTVSFHAGETGMVLAATTAAAATIGGAVAGVRTAPAVGAVVAATLTVFLVVLLLSQFNDQLLNLFGAGDSPQSRFTAAQWTARLASFTAGLAAGGIAFGYLGWHRRRALRHGTTDPAPRWPAYLLAGAGPGLVLALTEVIIRIGGRSLLDLAGALSLADSAWQRVLSGSRTDHAIGVLVIGALVALLAFGRTLGPAPEDEDDHETAETPAAGRVGQQR